MSVQPEAAPTVTPENPQTTRRAWGILLVAGVCEIAFAVSTDGSRGFTNLPWSIATVIAAAATIFTLSLALRTIDVGVGYAVWTGIGASGAAIFGAIIFGENLGPLRILFLAVIIAGVICLKLAGSSTDSAKFGD